MSVFSPRTLETLRTAVRNTMLSTCCIGSPQLGSKSGTAPAKTTYSYGNDIPCSVASPVLRGEKEDGTQKPEEKLLIKLPFGTVIDETYRIKLTSRYGEACELYYKVVGLPHVGIAAVDCLAEIIKGETR